MSRYGVATRPEFAPFPCSFLQPPQAGVENDAQQRGSGKRVGVIYRNSLRFVCAGPGRSQRLSDATRSPGVEKSAKLGVLILGLHFATLRIYCYQDRQFERWFFDSGTSGVPGVLRP